MTSRATMTSVMAAGIVSLSLAGCANEPLGGPWQTMSQLGGPLTVTAAAAEAPMRPALEPARKTLASKVLSALAFEKVTGLKADPARLLEAE